MNNIVINCTSDQRIIIYWFLGKDMNRGIVVKRGHLQQEDKSKANRGPSYCP